MKIIKEVIRDIEHIPKCPRSGEMNFYYYIVNPIKQKKYELHQILRQWGIYRNRNSC